MMPLSLGNIILLKEKQGMRESIPSRLIRSPGFPRIRKGSRALEKEKGVWGSQGERDKHSFLFSFVLINITVYLLRHVSL